MAKGQAPGIAKRQGVHRETVAEMRRKGLSDDVIEAKLAASKPKRERKKAAAKKAAAKPPTKAEKGKSAAEKKPAPKGPSAAVRANELQRKLEAAEMAKADRHILRSWQEAGNLVDAGQVFKAQQAMASQIRDSLLALPARIAGPMAARLGCVEALLRDELSKTIRMFLTEQTQPDANTTAA